METMEIREKSKVIRLYFKTALGKEKTKDFTNVKAFCEFFNKAKDIDKYKVLEKEI